MHPLPIGSAIVMITESSAMMGSHNGHCEAEEGDIQPQRWSRLLSWLESHGMDLSPSAFHVERRPRTGIKFAFFVSSSHRVNVQSFLDNPGAGYGLFLTSPCSVGSILLLGPVIHGLNEAAIGPTLRRPVIGVGKRQDARPPAPQQWIPQCSPAHLPPSLSAQTSRRYEGVHR